MEENLSLNWKSYSDHLKQMLQDLLTDESSHDVTLVCDDLKKIKAHRIVLKACSHVFASMLESESNAVVYLRGIQSEDLHSILQFMYLGEASMKHERMTEFLNVAKNLQIKDLCKMGNEKEKVLKVEEPLVLVGEENEDINYDDQPSSLEELGQQSQTKFKYLKSDHFLVDDDIIRAKDYQIDMVEGKHKCPMCKSLFIQKSAVLEHIKAKHEGIRWPCDKCDFVGTRKACLKRHVISKHFGKRWPCNFCNFQAAELKNLQAHLRSKRKHPELQHS